MFSRVLRFQRLTAARPNTRPTGTRCSRQRPTIRWCRTNVNTGTCCLANRLEDAERTANGRVLRHNVKVDRFVCGNENANFEFENSHESGLLITDLSRENSNRFRAGPKQRVLFSLF